MSAKVAKTVWLPQASGADISQLPLLAVNILRRLCYCKLYPLEYDTKADVWQLDFNPETIAKLKFWPAESTGDGFQRIVSCCAVG